MRWPDIPVVLLLSLLSLTHETWRALRIEHSTSNDRDSDNFPPEKRLVAPNTRLINAGIQTIPIWRHFGSVLHRRTPIKIGDVSQTEGDPLPDLDTEATGDTDGLVDRLTDAADTLGVTVLLVSADGWTHGEAKGIYEQLSLVDMHPRVDVRDRENDDDLARTVMHEYAHALLHFNVDDNTERSKCEVEVEAVAYVVGRYCGLKTSGSAFYLAAWASDDPEVVRERLGRISRTAEDVIEVLDD